NGNISGAGVFHPGTTGQGIKITATSAGVSGSAFADIVNFDVAGAFAYPNPYKSTQSNAICFTRLGTDSKIRIYTTTGRKVFETEITNSPAPTTPPHCDYSWPVTNSSGEKVASGVYLFVIESPAAKKNGKLIIIQ